MPFKISTEKVNNVKSHIYAGESITNIVAATGVSKYTVSLMKRKINPKYSRQSAGRRPLIPSSAQNIICLKLRSGQLRCIEGVQSYLGSIGHLVGYHATRNFVKKLWFKCKKKSNTAALNFIQMRQRYQWTRRHRYWTVQDWKKVIFSEESRFNLWGSDGVEYTYQYRGDSKKPFNYKTKRQQGGGSMIVLGCMTALGSGYACRLLEKSINSDLYRYVLGTTYLDTLRYYGLHHDDVIFQQDGATCHTANPTYQWMDREGMVYMKPWPANSPGLNPIEHLWHHIKSRLDRYPDRPSKVDKLWERFDYEWNKFDQATMKPYYNSYPRRIRAVIKARGGYTSF